MTPPVDLAARLRAESSGSEAFHGSEHWHPCAKFTGDENAGCIVCQWRFDAHLMWEAADALDALTKERDDSRFDALVTYMRNLADAQETTGKAYGNAFGDGLIQGAKNIRYALDRVVPDGQTGE